MTLLSVAQDVCDVIGLTRPSAVVSSTDPLARQILGLAKSTIEELGLMDWPMLEVPYSFNTVVDQTEYDLPSDWGREAGDTVYVASQYTQLRGSLTPGDWQRQRDQFAPQWGRYRFRVFGLPLKFRLTPAPQVVEEVVLEYQTTYRTRAADNTLQTTFYADTDTFLLSEELFKKGLLWRLRRAKGLDYTEEFNDYELARNSKLAQQLGLGSMPVAQRNQYDFPEELNIYIPENGYGA